MNVQIHRFMIEKIQQMYSSRNVAAEMFEQTNKQKMKKQYE